MHGAGGYDWLAVWREMYDRERAQAEALDRLPQPADCWEGQAARLATAWQRNEQPDSLMRFLLPHLRPDDTLLDIGAGTGRYACYLASHVRKVIALEPSAAMRAQLGMALASAPLPIEVREGAWPEASVGPVSVAFASHVLYGVREAGPFVQAMNRFAERACFLALAVQHPSAFISPFWERFYGEPRLPLPGALECLNLLHQLGIPAQMALVPRPGRVSFTSRDEALTDLRWRLRMVSTPESDAAILAAIDELMEYDGAGQLVPPNQVADTAIIWWERA